MTIVAITGGEDSPRGTWVIVTQERTAGSRPYTGLPSALHVTLARVQRFRERWAVSQWQPAP